MCNGVEWDSKSGTWNGEWVELQLRGQITQSGAFDDEAFSTAFDI